MAQQYGGTKGKPKGLLATHPDYDRMLPEWTACRDLLEGGTRRLREKCTEYLPPFFEEDSESYRARVNNTILSNFSYRTLVGYKGMLLRKPPVVKILESLRTLLQDVTLSGVPIEMFISEVAEEVLAVGRVGILTNYPDAPEGISQADAAAMNLRPSLHIYKAEAVDGWAHRRIDNRYLLSMVKIKETRSTNTDEFTVENTDVYRVLDLIAMPDKDGVSRTVYRVRIMRANKDTKVDETLEEYIPIMNGKPLDHIPFDFIGPDDTESDVDSPPFVDLVDVNYCHFVQLSAYLFGCFFSGIPQPYISGLELKAGDKLRIGGAAWVFPNPSTKVGMLETGAGGYIALQALLKRLEDTMAIIGSRLLETRHAGETESAATSELHFSGEHSVLAGIGQSISVGVTRRLKDFVEWTGNDPSDTSVTLTKHFFDTPLSPQARDSIVKAWQSGLMSDIAAFDALKNGGDYAANVTFEQEEANRALGTGLPIAPVAESIPTTLEDSSTQDSAIITKMEEMMSAFKDSLTTPTQPTMDMQPLVDAITAIPAPVVNVPAVDMSGVIEAIKAMPAPQVTVAAQDTPDFSGVIAAIQAMPAPQVNVAAPPEADFSGVIAAIQAMPAPIVNVPETVVNVPAPIVNITQAEQQQPAPIVLNTGGSGQKTVQFTKDASGKLTGATVTEA